MNSSLNVGADSFVDLLRRLAGQRPEQKAYTFLVDGEIEGEGLTFGELDRRAKVIAAALQAAGAAGERALLLYPPGLEFVAAFFGCLYAGTVAVPAYPPRMNQSQVRIKGILEDARPRVALATSPILSRMESLAERQPELRSVRWMATDALPPDLADAWRETPVAREDTAFLQYTSGSTSTPKGVVISHGHLLANQAMIREAFAQTERSVIVGWLPPYHDMGLIGTVLHPLYLGARCILMSPNAFLQRPVRWLQAITRYGGTTSGGPNFSYELCVSKVGEDQKEGLDLSSWSLAFNGAEPVQAETLRRFARAFECCGFRSDAFYPCYGLAEATLFVAGGSAGSGMVVETVEPSALEQHRVTTDTPAAILPLVGCGRPWQGQRLAIVDPETRRLCPPDQVGEIWVAGPSIAGGYWNREEETEQTFAARLADGDEGPFLATGDLGFVRQGNLFVTGRLKDLIIVRGRNHYPQDLELAAEKSHPDLRPGGGAAFTVEVDGEQRLVVVHELRRHARSAVAEVAQAIRRTLAEEHEIAVHEVVLIRAGALPKTSSGKVRRSACRSLYLEGGLAEVGGSTAGRDSGGRLAPVGQMGRDELLALPAEERLPRLTELLRQRLARVAGVAPGAIDTRDPASAAGVDSLAAAELQQGIEEALGIAPPLSAILEGGSLADLAAGLLRRLETAAAGTGRLASPPAPRSEEEPLSAGQKALWFFERMVPESRVYSIVSAAHVHGDLDTAALERSFQALADRHGALRTTFADRGGEPMQRVHGRLPVGFLAEDAAGWSAAELTARLGAEARRPFDLAHGPLLRVAVFFRGPRQHVLFFAVHHIVADFWSLVELMRELAALYRQETGGAAAELEALPLEYTDAVRRQQAELAGEAGEALWAYWREELAGKLPELELPLDRPRPSVQTYHGASLAAHYGTDLARGLEALGRRHGVTLFVTLLAACQALLHHYTGQVDLLIGSPAAGRGHASLARLVGYFVNAFPLRGDLSGDPGFSTLLARARRTVLGALEHQALPFATLAARLQPWRDPARSPLFQAMVVLQRAHLPCHGDLSRFALGEEGARARLGDLELESIKIEPREVPFDLTLMFAVGEDGLSASFQYNTDLFDRSTVARMSGHLRMLLAGAAREPEQHLSALPFLTDAEWHQLVTEWAGAGASPSASLCLHERFAQQADVRPDTVAVCFGEQSVTYGELRRRAACLARRLESLGVGPEVTVGLCLERSIETVTAILGVLEAGGAYVPLDPAYPAERLAFCIEESRMPVLLTTSGLVDRLPRQQGATSICLDDDAVGPAGSGGPRNQARPDNLAYVIYTSGSTGRPKGVGIPHSNVERLFTSTAHWFGFGETDVWTLFHSFAFDFSVWELWGALACGGRLVVVPYLVSRSPEALADLLEEQRVTVLNQTPSAFYQLIGLEERESRAVGPDLRWVVFGGEALDAGRLAPWFQRHRAERPELVNMYGITETTVHVTYRPLGAGEAWAGVGSAIGQPIPDLSTFVLGAGGRPLPARVPGELYVGGAGLARGYLGRPDLTASRFVPDSFSDVPGARLYRTGDLVRRRADGALEFLGRIDNQVKVRGYRIELGEIEASLAAHPALRGAAVLARESGPGELRLVAYYVPASSAGPGVEELREFLRSRLPLYMVPAVFVPLEALPLTPNGKLDRRALPEPDATRPELGSPYVAPLSAAEELLVDIWQSVLGLDKVGIHDNFFRLGGDSILSLQVITRAAEAGYRIRPKQLFLHQTIAELAAAVGSSQPAADQGAVTGPVPLTPIQRWFFALDLPQPHHWNQTVVLEASHNLDLCALAAAAQALMEHHDALRSRFVRGEDGWRQLCRPPGEQVPLTLVDLQGLPEGARETAFSWAASRCQAGLDLASGPLVRLAVFHLGPALPSRILLAIHHLVVDGVSWRLLLEDLASGYGSRRRGDVPRLPDKTTSYKTWSERLSEHLRSGALAGEIAYWEALEGGRRLPRDLPAAPEDNVEASARTVSMALTEDETAALLHDIPRSSGATLQDALLAALACALAPWLGTDGLLVDVEGHGREDLFDDIDLSRTVGWFTAIYPLRLDLGTAATPAASLRAVQEQMGRVPGRGIGFGVLRYLGSESAARLAALPPSELAFNYLGQVDEVLAEGFRLSFHSPGPLHAPRGRRTHVLEINALVAAGRLRVDWTFSERLHRRGTIEELSHAFAAALRALLEDCRGRANVALAGFPGVRLQPRDLEQVAAILGEDSLDDLYPLSPLQEGLLFHTLLAPESGAYFEQLLCLLEGDVDAGAFELAWQGVIDRYALLRTAFLAGLEEPLQIVAKRARAAWDHQDWRTLSPAEQDRRLQDLLAADRARGFDIAKPPLMRLSLVDLGGRSWFVWSFHHLLLDGWSVPLVLQEVSALYQGSRERREVKLPAPPPYRDYIAWLRRQDLSRADTFWRSTLAGFTAPTPLPADRGTQVADSGERQIRQIVLPQSATSALGALARRHHLTVNTIVQGVWALLLAQTSGAHDVLFGVSVSGRPAELPGVERMVGLFINTLPLRATLSFHEALLPFLRRVQAAQVDIVQVEHSPLVRVQAASEVPRGLPLFESLLTYENYPVDGSLRERLGGLVLAEAKLIEKTHYPMVLLVEPLEEMRLRITYDPGRFEATAILRLLGHLEALFDGAAGDLATGGRGTLGDLPLLAPAERHQLLVEWNDTTGLAAAGASIHGLFEAKVDAAPEPCAVIAAEGELTYRELERQANRLAHRLRSAGVGAGTMVAVFLERGLRMVPALLGILKAGGAYVPVESGWPPARVRWILENLSIHHAVTEPSRLETPAGHEILALGDGVVVLDGEPDARAALPESRPRSGVGPEDLAYVIFTSGSTGTPKGVLVRHGAVLNLIDWVNRTQGVGPRDRVLFVTSLSFDLSVYDVFGVLAAGGSIRVASSSEVRDPEALVRALREEPITFWDSAPAALQQLVPFLPRPGTAAGCLSRVFLSGDWIPLPLPDQVRASFPGARVLGLGGATEATVWSNSFAVEEVDPAWASIPYGRPIQNARYYVLESSSGPCAVGVEGDLYIGGACLAAGYVNDAVLTASKYVPDPYSPEPGGRMYATGDRARFGADGTIEFLGRLDQQVKIRGFRIELGEIESVLGQHLGLREVVVLARGAERTSKRLVAYGVPRSWPGPSAEELRSFVRERLPEHMVPSAYVLLESWPLTANGKLDRRALPEPGAEPVAAEAGSRTPWTATEELLAGLWSQVLGVERVGAQDNFFELGGHSLLATQLVSRVREVLQVDLPLRSLFEAPTLSSLAAQVDAALRSDRPALPALELVERTGGLALSFAQERLWFLEQLEPGGWAYNIPFSLEISGRLDVAAFAGALAEVVRRHESLRTTFGSVAGRPVQVIAAPGEALLPIVSLSGLEPSAREAEAARLEWDECRRPFDLARGPLLRACLLRLAEDEHLLLLTMHHIVADGWSVGVLVREMTALYEAFTAGRPSPLPELPLQYVDFASWQRRWLSGETLEAQLSYWRRHLAELPAILELPTDRSRPSVQTSRGATFRFTLPVGLEQGLRKLGRREGGTLFMVLATALEALLHVYTSQEDFSLGTVVAGRNQGETEGLVGFFVNTLVLRGRLKGRPTFRELLNRVRQDTLGAYSHQDLPFEKLIEELRPERNLERTPLFQVVLALQNMPLPALELEGITLTPRDLDTGTAKFDFDLIMSEVAQGLAGAIEYNTDLFDRTSIVRLIGHFTTLLTAMAADPEKRLASPVLLSEADRHQLSSEWNDTGFEHESLPFHRLFEARAARFPQRVAAVHGSRFLTYGELDRQSNRLARALAGRGLQPGTLLALLAERSLEFLITMLAVFKAGGAYVPLDPLHPPRRLAQVLGGSRAALALVSEDLEAKLRQALAEMPAAAGRPLVLSLEQELSRMPMDRRGDDDLPDRCETGDLSYVIFTSGSTGAPKGAMLEHRGMVNHLFAKVAELALTEDDQVAQTASQCFDISVWQFLAVLLAGGSVHVFEDDIAHDPARLTDALCENRTTVVETVPSLMRFTLDDLRRRPTLPDLSFLRWMIPNGEALPPDLCHDWLELYPGVPLINAYGPTECSDDVTQQVITEPPGWGTVPIGRPLANLQLYVLDRHLEPVPLGVPGEICVGGTGVGRGYLFDPRRTAEAFVPDPFSATPGRRLYRTGDLGRRLASGELAFLARIDQQVKIRGFRIELGEVESVLQRHPAVHQAAAMAHGESGGEKRLVAYVVPREEVAAESAGQEAAIRKAEWQAIYDEVYRSGTSSAVDSGINLRVWIDSYTGQPLPEAEIVECFEDTVARILRLRPRRVLEIGCGTGLLLFRISPCCESYVGTDMAREALAAIRRRIAEQDGELPPVTLLHRAADDFEGIDEQSFDLVIINEVVQYFPGAEYLLQVVDGALARVEPGGCLFVGGVRSLPHLEAFHASVELFQAADSLRLDELRQRVRKRAEAEKELAVDPELFLAIREHHHRIGSVRVELKGGVARNELTKFRYDVFLQMGPEPAPVEETELDWRGHGLSLPMVMDLLERDGPALLLVTGVPNPRVLADLRSVELLAGDRDLETVAALRSSLKPLADQGVAPSSFWQLERDLPYRVEVCWSSSPERFDVLFSRRNGALHQAHRPLPRQQVSPRSWRRYTNDPLRDLAIESLVPRLRRFAAESLPDYMVPSVFVALEAMPLNANGKLDRKRLPVPEQARPDLQGFVAPRNEVEATVAAIWSEVLGLGRVGAHDDFFEIGGHSLRATQVMSRVREELAVEVPLRQFFASPTVAGLARWVEERRAQQGHVGSQPIHPVPRDRPLRLSFGQERLWFIDQLEPGSAAYNLTIGLRLRGRLRHGALAWSLSEVLRRHEALRTTFGVEGGAPVQYVSPGRPLALPRVDLAALPASLREAEARHLSGDQANRALDLSRDPLFRSLLVTLDEGDHVLLVLTHHIVFDGSYDVFLEELAALYSTAAAGEPALLPLPAVQYADFAAWQRDRLQGEALETLLAYWRERLGGDLPVLALPTDRPRPARLSFRGGNRFFSLDPGAHRGLLDLARGAGATTFAAALSVFVTLLHRHSGQDDVVVGVPIVDRPRAEVENLIGCFVNTLALRTSLAGNPGFDRLLDRVWNEATGAYAHKELPFELLVDALQPNRDLSRMPLFQAMFVLNDARRLRGLRLPDLAADAWHLSGATARFDLLLTLWEGESESSGTVEYNADLFDVTTIERLLGHFRTLLVGAAELPVGRLSELPMLSAAQRHQLCAEWNDTGRRSGGERAIHELFEARVSEATDAVAVIAADGELTRGGLDREANRLAWHLRSLGVGPGDLVGIHLERSAGMIAALLGILKAGAAYAPLEPGHPPARFHAILEALGSRCVVTRGSGLQTLALFADDLPRLRHIVCLDPPQPVVLPAQIRTWWTSDLERSPEADPCSGVGPEDLAYVIFTSGSTGTPKGVLVRHGAVLNLIDWVNRTQGVGPRDRVLFVTSLSFDLSVYDVFGVLAAGGSIRVASSSEVRDPEALVRALCEEPITLWDSAPAALQQLVPFLPRPGTAAGCLSRVFLSGDWIPLPLPDQVRASFPAARVLGLGGATEATVWSNSFAVEEVAPAWASIPYGRPIQNARYYVLESSSGPCAVGVEGDLYIGGACLAAGYVNDAGLTASKYVPDPYSPEPGGRMYATGDRARFGADGTIEFLGRLDQQVKIRGFRIELGEIESVLGQHPGLREVVVLARGAERTSKRLVAYGASRSWPGPSAEELRSFVRERLPEHMVPSAYVLLESWPLTANGKLDRRALPEPGAEPVAAEAGSRALWTATEELLAGLWSQVLGVERVGAQDNFFELGGHSLLATQLVSRVREVLRVDLPLRSLFEAPTLSSLAAQVDAALRSDRPAPPALERVERTGDLVLSFAQERLWFLEQLEPGGWAYNIPFSLEISGRLDVAAFAGGLAEVVRRHESLRTTFGSVAGRPVQVIAAPGEASLPLVSLTGLEPSAREAETARLEWEECRRPFDLARGPLLRACLLRLAEDEHLLLLSMHHIVSDGWSVGVLIREMTVLYESFTAGRPSPLPELPLQYADFAHWQRHWLSGETLEAQILYWRRHLAGLPPVLDLPTDLPRPPVQTFRGAAQALTLTPDLESKLRALGRKEAVTPFMVLLAAFLIMLRDRTGQIDLVVGTNVAGRSRSQTEGLIGFFINQLVLRTDLSGDPSFRDLLARVREVALGAYAHQDLPFERLVEELRPERDRSRPLLFQVKVELESIPDPPAELAGLELKAYEGEERLVRYDLHLLLQQRPAGLCGWLQYNADLFYSVTIAQMLGDLQIILLQAVEDPDTCLGSFLESLSRASQDRRREEEQRYEESLLRRLKRLPRKPAGGQPEARTP